MEFVKEFATFLFEKKVIRFGDFTLASGKKSPYYIDLRLIPSFPHEYRKMIKGLQNLIADDIGFENFHSLVSVPTGGLIVAASLATEINQNIENIGARRLHTIMEKLLEDVSFNASDIGPTQIVINGEYVENNLGEIIKSQDLSKFIL